MDSPFGYWLLAQTKNNKTYFLTRFTVDKDGAVWTTAEQNAMKFDGRSFAVKFKNTYFTDREDVFMVSREIPTF